MDLKQLAALIKDSFEDWTDRQPTETELIGLLAWAQLFGRYGQLEPVVNGQKTFVQSNNPGRVYDTSNPNPCPKGTVFDATNWFFQPGPGQCVVVYEDLQAGVNAWIYSVSTWAQMRQALETGDAGALSDLALVSGVGGWVERTAANWEKGAGYILSAVASAHQQFRGFPMQKQLWSIKTTPSYYGVAGPAERVKWQDLLAGMNQIQKELGFPDLTKEQAILFLALIGAASDRGLINGKQTFNFNRAKAAGSPPNCPAGSQADPAFGLCVAERQTVRQGLEKLLQDLQNKEAPVAVALGTNDPGKIAAAMLEADYYGPGAKTGAGWLQLSEVLRGMGNEASKSLHGEPLPANLLPRTMWEPSWAAGTLAEALAKGGIQTQGQGKGEGGEPSESKTRAPEPKKSLTTTQIVAAGAGIMALGAVGLFFLLRRPSRAN